MKFVPKTSTTRQILLSTLRSLGYTSLELLINPLQFGIPNSRLRYYCLAKRTPYKFHGVVTGIPDKVWRHIPGHATWTDPRLDAQHPVDTQNEALSLDDDILQIHEYLDEQSSPGEPHPNVIPEKVLLKWGRLFDIVVPSSRRTCCFTRGYSQLVERAGSVIQVNESLDTTETFNKFLQARSENDEDAIQILRPLGLRYFSPAELLRIFHFTPPQSDSIFAWPAGISTKTKYRLIGNSVNVKVVKELIRYLFQE
ncbi:hypothetical protein DXG03_001990 [Asterophora parasitica]|uniref:tRNA (cytosine(38)-C(5))-methyltransferase n=1 Tax=Asterophora parasitica TaxID=117018 RepID=A0A9P7GAG9_9AGAR|nr:hypothetical protein DXG03_001990 [Asterophora parasitica]